jgi:hypothetical protein
METLATFVAYLLLAMLVFVLAVVVLSILVAFKKIPVFIGYVVVGLQAVLTVFAFQLTQTLGLIASAVLFISAVLVFVIPSSKR